MKILTPLELEELICRIFIRHGMAEHNAKPIAAVVRQAEQDASPSHGVFRVPAYVETLKSGAVNGHAMPKVVDQANSVVRVDADNGFAQPALQAAKPLVLQKAKANGLAALAIHNSHHFAALWPDVESFANEGMLALAFVNSRRRIAPWDARERLLGTNPMAFACPQSDGPPIVWDQASSIMAQGAALLLAKEGKQLEPGMLVDENGDPSIDPTVLLRGGALRSFGGHKGSAIALMVEIMGGALTGGNFGFEDTKSETQGSATQNAGEFILVLDPVAFGVPELPTRITALLSFLREGGVSRFPSESRYKARQKNLHQISINTQDYQHLLELAS